MAGIQLGLIGSFPTPVTSSFESIATATGTGSSQTITFSSIPSAYKHLQIRGIGRLSAATDSAYARIRLNGDSGTNYSEHILYGNGTSVFSSGVVSNVGCYSTRYSGSTAPANVLGAVVIDIHDYTSTTKNKTIMSFGGVNGNLTTTDYWVTLSSGCWMNTSAVNSVTIYGGSNWTTQTTFSLYGIKGA